MTLRKAGAVAATKPKALKPHRKGAGALCALTAAALALPGLMASPVRADEGDEFNFEYHHYTEGERNLYIETYKDLNLRPIQVDSADLELQGHIVDRVKFALNYMQDTWSGATLVMISAATSISSGSRPALAAPSAIPGSTRSATNFGDAR